MRFFDSNIVVYGYDNTDARKHAIAQQLLAEAPLQGDVVVSTQVFGEFFNAAVTKRKIMTAEEVRKVILKISAGIRVAEVDLGLVRDAIAIHQRYKLRYWDSLIIATAKRMKCVEVLSEDMADGQDYGGVIVRNSFKP
jgi:predicted nucleic acid-binding protein